ncbi:GGDEF domain-containing protein [Brevibacillus sp. MER 51]|uniref:GGDEF domain-containing protein n=1 Tax=Brevibacillus sp. MER 51 TaxID=2939560 RepID=UPI00203FAE41|nr:GGDEF domain-containing protein [Brevibacillus sp. MER 51]MCM3143147.1 GGDEF domain-containing protein [Brevibacillus sp. MER 51]
MGSRWISLGVSCVIISVWLIGYGLPRDESMFVFLILVGVIQSVAAYQIGKYVDRLRQMAYHDSLTGVLVNRRFLDKLVEEVELAKSNHQSATLLFIDLDNFKIFNDSFGHLEGDRLLCQFARLLQASVRKQDTVGRWGGEEFVVLLAQTDTRRGLAIGERIQNQVRQALSGVTVSIGVASYPHHAATAEELAKKADMHMYEAKKRKDCMMVASNEMINIGKTNTRHLS